MRSMLILVSMFLPRVLSAQIDCEQLASLSVPNAAITMARIVNAGEFTMPVNPATRVEASLQR